MKKTIAFLTAGVLAAAMVTPVLASSFTPSVEQKEAPVIVVPKDDSGIKVAVAIVEDGKIDNVVDPIPVEAVQVTAVSNLEKAPKAVQEEMTKAYESISTAGSLQKAVPQLVEAVKEQVKVSQETAVAAGKAADSVKEVKVENLVVRDMVHIELKPEYLKQLDEKQNVRLCFDLKLEKDAFLMVMVFVDGEWVVVAPQNVRILPTGEAVVALNQLGPVAFIVEKDS